MSSIIMFRLHLYVIHRFFTPHAGMAEFDDIEYEGIGEDRHIAVGSDRCFRDYSPGDIIISLSDEGQALYSYAIPPFPDPSQTLPGPNEGLQQPQSEIYYRNILESDISGTLPPLRHESLVAIQQNAPLGLADGLSPLTRYRRDPQAHEQRALGIKPNNASLHPNSESEHPTPTKPNGKPQSSEISSLHLSSSPNPTPSTGRGSSSAAAQLQELLDVIESPGWEDGMSPEEQAEHLRRATRLKRRVRSETNPRESRLPKVRKRDRVGLRGGKEYRRSS
ncbi:hypothetical protein F4805DRAFT_388030 [Annulohypoxylon moriforme]|nr:hypothetical protein F4805DRAFT_388030 [Annulohypoxylon moriforme]